MEELLVADEITVANTEDEEQEQHEQEEEHGEEQGEGEESKTQAQSGSHSHSESGSQLPTGGSTTSNQPTVGSDHAESSVRKDNSVDHSKAKEWAREQAVELQKNLDKRFPSFVKSMVPSQVGGCYMLGIPTPFKKYLPKKETLMTLIDENGVTSSVKYKGKGFSVGWKAFSIDHKLFEGDALVFQLVKPDEFQVFIVRADGSAEVDLGSASEVNAKQSSIRVCTLAKAQSKEIENAEAVTDHDESSPRTAASADDTAKKCAREQAAVFIKGLHPKCPSFIKSVVKSQVSGCYTLALPRDFCNSYLPEDEYILTLVDKNKATYTVTYTDKIIGAGWKAFVVDHDLNVGDSLVFQLTKSTELQVNIIRAHMSSRSNISSSILNSEGRGKRHAPRVYFPLEARSSTVKKKPEVGANQVSARTRAIDRAEEIQRKLDPNYPNFVKAMFPSNVGGSFWLALSAKFCTSHLPENDAMITMVGENGEEHTVKFIVKASAISGGWKRFAVANNLVEGDVLVFQLIEEAKFKVYISRVELFGENRGSGPKENSTQGKRTKRLGTPEKTERKRRKTASCEMKNIKGEDLAESEPGDEEKLKSIKGGDIGSDASRVTSSRGTLDANSILSVIDGLKEKCKLSEETWTNYYELCCSQRDLLHKDLPPHNDDLMGGIISETVVMACRIRACTLSTTSEEFDAWDKCLKGFKHLGMNVRFIRLKLRRVKKLVCGSANMSKEQKEALADKAQTTGRIKSLEAELADLKEYDRKLDAELAKHSKNTKSHELELQKELDAPW